MSMTAPLSSVAKFATKYPVQEALAISLVTFNIACFVYTWFQGNDRSLAVAAMSSTTFQCGLYSNSNRYTSEAFLRVFLVVNTILTGCNIYNACTSTRIFQDKLLDRCLKVEGDGADLKTNLLLRDELREEKFRVHPKYPLTEPMLRSLKTLTKQNDTFYRVVLEPLLEAYRKPKKGQQHPDHIILNHSHILLRSSTHRDLEQLYRFSDCLEHGKFY